MQLLAVRQRDLRVVSQKIMERGRSRLLRTGHYEIQSLDLSMFNAKHLLNRDTALVRCPRWSAIELKLRELFVTGKADVPS
jgi:hypothetical protein